VPYHPDEIKMVADMNETVAGRNLDWRTVSTENCPVAGAMQILGEKWTLLIIRDAFNGIKRFDDFCAQTRAPRALVINRLKYLVDEGVLCQEPYQEPGSRSRLHYVLTRKGRDLQYVLIALREWGDVHINESGKQPVELIEKNSGVAVRLALVRTDDDTLMETTNIRMQPGPGFRRRSSSARR
jgi:DNA-binding HxlR family transcriptional regulator